MKIAVTGTRGIPDIQGGVETHCQELFTRIAAMGHEVTVIRRSCYVPDVLKEYKGVHLKDVYAPRIKSLEAIFHTFLAVIEAKRQHVDILHVHAVGPAIMVPLARLLGLKVVMTHHGPDYDRQKWGKLARMVLKTGERWGVKYAKEVIVISRVIDDIIRREYNRENAHLIYNGVNKPVKSQGKDYISSLGLEEKKYIVALGRFVPEKGFHDLVDAYTLSEAPSQGYKLVIAGDSDHEDDYSKGLKTKAMESGVVLTGFIKGERLNQIMSNAALFVLPSYHEGLPIALLEAMSYDLDVLTSDIPANMIDELTAEDHFPVGDINGLSRRINEKLSTTIANRHYDLSRYDWDNIARETVKVYDSIRLHS